MRPNEIRVVLAIAIIGLLFANWFASLSAVPPSVTTDVESRASKVSVSELTVMTVASTPPAAVIRRDNRDVSTTTAVGSDASSSGGEAATREGADGFLAVRPSPSAVWYSLADCESGLRDRHGNIIPGSARWHYSGPGEDGGLQFKPSTWIAAGGRAYGEHAYDATPEEQILVARLWLGRTSTTQWPVCSKIVGLRDSDGIEDGDQ